MGYQLIMDHARQWTAVHGKLVAIVGGGILSSVVLYRAIQSWLTSRKYAALGRDYRKRCEERLQALRDRLAAQKIPREVIEKYTSVTLEELIHKLQSGEWKSVDVLKAFQTKALESHEKTNCLIEPVLEAEQWAESCDQAEDKSCPLHGLPISIKESIEIKGYIESKGLGKLCESPSKEDYHVLRVLIEQGAVPFVRTGIPQLLLSYEGSNPIFGKVVSPFDPTRISGGSSSGEGALIGDGGSILGIGTDIGGSVRVPCAFSGICGLKPGAGRVGIGPKTPPAGQTVVRPVWGPMAWDVNSLKIAMESVLVPSFFNIANYVPPLAFRNDVYESTKPLTIGYHSDDGYYPSAPACQRAVLLAKAALEKMGHRLVPWKPPNIHKVMQSASVPIAFSADAGKTLQLALQNEPVDGTLSPGIISYLFESSWKAKLRTMFLRMMKRHNEADFIDAFHPPTDVYNWWGYTTSVESYRIEVLQDVEKNGLDAILSPAFLLPTPKFGNSDKLLRIGSYMYVYNVLDWPAGVVPVTRVTQKDVDDLKDYHTGDDIEHFVRKDMSDGVGLPVAVQCAAKTWNEELVLRVMRDVQDGIKQL